MLGAPVLHQPVVAHLKPSFPVSRNRLGLGRSLLLEAPLGVLKPGPPSPAACQLAGQLIAARRAAALVLGGVDALRLGQHLGGDLLVAENRGVGGRGPELRPVDRDHPGPHQPRLDTETQHLTEQPRQRLMAHPKARDRGVVGHLVRADHPKRDVLAAAPLDRPRGALTDAIGVGQQRHHHLRVVRRATVTVNAIGRVERLQVELLDRLDHEPGQMVFIQPVAQVRRQQQRLLTVTPKEVLGHRPQSLPANGRKPRGLCDTLA